MKIFGARALLFLFVLFSVCVVFTGIFFMVFKSTPDKVSDSGKVKYYFGGDMVRKAKTSDVISGDSVYFCFNDFAEYFDMAESGSAKGTRFIFKSDAGLSGGDGTEEYISFSTDSCDVYINGQHSHLDVQTKMLGTETWVSIDVLTEYFYNLSCVYNAKKSTVKIARVKDEEKSTEKDIVYLPVSFKLKKSDTIEPIPEDFFEETTDVFDAGAVPSDTDADANGSLELPLKDDTIKETTPPAETKPAPEPEKPKEEPSSNDLGFTLDLSDYEEYMNPADRDGFLKLVNTVNLITESELPNDLVECSYTAAGRKTQSLRLYAERALDALMKEMKAAGYTGMRVYSGYRSMDYQKTLFENYTNNEMAKNPSLSRADAEQIVLTYSTRPGTSEHHTGLAVDMDTRGDFSTDFAYSDEFKWLSDNAWKFGFILRFPADKTDITTIQFEPWHYRYVGRYHAKKIHDSGLCLEEYLSE